MKAIITGEINKLTFNKKKNQTIIEGDIEVSDSYHTFNELYAHRIMLFIALMKSHKDISWKSRLHDDGTSYDGWFVGGMNLPSGIITYHIPDKYWGIMEDINIIEKSVYDGHTADDVIIRLNNYIFSMGSES